MRRGRLSFRQKMILPAAVAVAATLVAIAVTQTISASAAARLHGVEERDFPTLEFAQDLERALGELHRGLQDAVAARDESGVSLADELHEVVTDHLASERAKLLAPARVTQIRAEVDDYYAVARAVSLRWIHGEKADSLVEPLRDMTARYNRVREDLAHETKLARAAMTGGFDQAIALQRRSTWAGSFLLLAAALAGAGLAWWLATRAARPLDALNAAALRIAQGDLTREIEVSGDDEIGTLAASFRTMVVRLRSIVATLKESSLELGGAADRLGDLTRTQSAFLERQASGVTETSTTTRELEQASSVAASRAASVLEVARRAGEMSDSGQEAAQKSVDGLTQIQGSVESIVGQSTRLLEQARQVGDIVETVRDLATQSHVLSLNASIEAARAGEAGRGFAVVASEVRALAEQSGESASRIAKIVQDILGAIQATLEMTERGNRGMEGSLAQVRASGESLREIGGIVRETSDAALHIASAVQQQSQGIAQIASAMRDLDKGMEETVSRIQTLEQSAGQVAETASRISMIANGFQV